MDAGRLLTTLDEISRLQAELAGARDALPSHDERLAAARGQLDRAAESFQQKPFRVANAGPAAITALVMGAMMALAPASAIELVEKHIRSGPPGLDRHTRNSRIAAAESKIAGLVRSLSYDDLRQMRRIRDEAFVLLKSLTYRRTELQQGVQPAAAGDRQLPRGPRRARPATAAHQLPPG